MRSESANKPSEVDPPSEQHDRSESVIDEMAVDTSATRNAGASGQPQSSMQAAEFGARRDAKHRSQRTSRGKADGVDAGADFERRVARLEFAEGALARLRVPVRVDADAGRQELTDLDVLALDFDNRLRLTRSVLECKSGRGQSGEGDRLLWLSGLQKLLGVDRAVLVRQTITRRGQSIATALELQILDSKTLSTREAAYSWLPERFAHIDGDACSWAEGKTDVQLKGLSHISTELAMFLRFKGLLNSGDHSLVELDKLRMAVEDGGVLPNPTRMILAGHALQALCLVAMQHAGQLDTLPAELLKHRLELALTVGSPEDDNLLAVLGLADQLMARTIDTLHHQYMVAGAKRIEASTPLLRELVGTPPVWVDRYLDLVQRLRVTPDVARQLPQTIELLCFDALLGDNAYRAEAFDHLFTPQHRSLVMGCLRMLKDICGTQIADALASVAEVDFSRAAPALPNRTSRPTP
jgi:hypothetical protein